MTRQFRHVIVLFALLLPSVAAAQRRPITHEDLWTLQRIGAPALSPDGKLAVFTVTEPSYDSSQTVTDLWIIATDGSAPARRFTNTRGGEGGATFSPDGTLVAFTARREGDDADQVYLQPVGGGPARRLTTIATGASSPKFRPDGRAVLFETSSAPGPKPADSARAYDAFPVRFWNRWLDPAIEPVIGWQLIDSTVPTLVPVTPLRGSFDGAGGEVLNPVWTPDGRSIVFEAGANRADGMREPTETSLYIVPAGGGARRRIAPSGVSYSNPMFSPDGLSLYAMESRLPSARQIYFVTRLVRFSVSNWSLAGIVTEGWDRTVSALTITPDSKTLYVQAEDEGVVKIFRTTPAGGKPEVVQAPGMGAVTDISAKGDMVIGKFSASTDPGQIVRVDMAGKRYTTLTTFNAEKLATLLLPVPEHFWFTASNGKQIHSIVVPPPTVENGKKYPVIVFPHGGPNSMSADSFSTRWSYQLLGSQGYYVMATNYTGSTGFGEKFADDIERDVLRGPATEVLEAVAAAGKKYTQMDLGKQCAAGASYGGYLTNWFNGNTNQFKCLVTHAGAVNNESQYGFNDGGIDRELRMGAPIWETGKGQWFDQSPIRYSKNWKTPNLITQGELDYRVPIAESMTTFKLLQRLKVPVRLVVFPDEGHWVLKGPNSRRHMDEVLGWFAKYLK